VASAARPAPWPCSGPKAALSLHRAETARCARCHRGVFVNGPVGVAKNSARRTCSTPSPIRRGDSSQHLFQVRRFLPAKAPGTGQAVRFEEVRTLNTAHQVYRIISERQENVEAQQGDRTRPTGARNLPPLRPRSVSPGNGVPQSSRLSIANTASCHRAAAGQTHPEPVSHSRRNETYHILPREIALTLRWRGFRKKPIARWW